MQGLITSTIQAYTMTQDERMEYENLRWEVLRLIKRGSKLTNPTLKSHNLHERQQRIARMNALSQGAAHAQDNRTP